MANSKIMKNYLRAHVRILAKIGIETDGSRGLQKALILNGKRVPMGIYRMNYGKWRDWQHITF